MPLASTIVHYIIYIQAPTVTAWKYFLKYCNTSDQPVNISLPFKFLLSAIAPKLYENRGIKYVSDIFQNNKPVPFATIVSQYALPEEEVLTFALLTSFQLHSPISDLEPSPKIWQFSFSPNSPRKGISIFFHCLHDKLSFTVSKPLLKWLAELIHPIPGQQWRKAVTTL